MSERRSWDVQPRRVSRPQAAPRKRSVSVNAVRTRRAPAAHSTGRGRLRERRRKARTTALIILVTGIALLLGLVVYLLWLPAVRIQYIEATGPSAESVEETAGAALSGTHLLILPKNSIFFFPKSEVR